MAQIKIEIAGFHSRELTNPIYIMPIAKKIHVLRHFDI